MVQNPGMRHSRLKQIRCRLNSTYDDIKFGIDVLHLILLIDNGQG